MVNKVFLLQDGYISFKEFICALSITSRGTLDEKLDCKYNITLFITLLLGFNAKTMLIKYVLAKQEMYRLWRKMTIYDFFPYNLYIICLGTINKSSLII